VAIVSASLVREYFPHENPLGQQVRTGTNQWDPWLTIVGVVEDEKHTQLMHEMSWTSNPTVYRPLEQDVPNRIEILTRENNGAKLPAIEAQIAALDPDVPVSDWYTMEGRLQETTKFARFRAALLSWFALATILLAGIGLHGVLAQLVAQRTKEFGIRLAMGAQARDVFLLVARQGGVSILLGLGMGVSGALVLERFLFSLFYEGRSADWRVMILVTTVLLLVGSAATWLPAWRASRVDPAVTLRNE
jgi:ABC-type lipoprotein release transport system permease subunit